MAPVKLEHTDLAQHQGGILQQLRKFWMEGHLCDVVLKSHDGEHCAHTAILSAASMYFRSLLCGSFLEADRVQKKQPVEIAASKSALSALLDYIYGGQPEVNLETGVELLRLAEAYDLPKLASAIDAGIRFSLDGVKALRILQETHGLHSLKDASEEKVAEDFEACSQHPNFGKLSAIQLAWILKREDLSVSREEVVFRGIFNWFNCSKDRHGFGMLQHVDFQAFSLENLLRLGRFPPVSFGEELHREVDQSSNDFQLKRHCFMKRHCFKHWSPDLGANIASGREVLPLLCYSFCWHEGHIYATDYKGSVLSWKPGDPATSVRKIAGEGAPVTGINNLGSCCGLAISPTGEMFVSDSDNRRIVRFQNACGYLVLGDFWSEANCVVCSPNGVVYVLVDNEELPGSSVKKLVGSTLQTVIASESLPEELRFSAPSMFVTKEEVIYLCDWANNRVLCVNPAESLEPVVVGQFQYDTQEVPMNLCGIFVTESGTIYVWEENQSRKVFAFRPGDTTPTEVLQCPGPLRPGGLVVEGRSLYVSMVDDFDKPTTGGIYEYLLPVELQLEWRTSSSQTCLGSKALIPKIAEMMNLFCCQIDRVAQYQAK